MCAAGELDRTGRQWMPVIEWELTNATFGGNPYDLEACAVFVHEPSGERRTTPMFYDGELLWKFRFTATRPGRWKLTTQSDDPDLDGHRGVVTIKPNPTAYGFVTHVGNKWARQRGVALAYSLTCYNSCPPQRGSKLRPAVW